MAYSMTHVELVRLGLGLGQRASQFPTTRSLRFRSEGVQV